MQTSGLVKFDISQPIAVSRSHNHSAQRVSEVMILRLISPSSITESCNHMSRKLSTQKTREAVIIEAVVNAHIFMSCIVEGLLSHIDPYIERHTSVYRRTGAGLVGSADVVTEI